MDHEKVDRRIYQLYPSVKATDAAAGNRNRREILELAPKNGVGVEIGVFTGRFSRVLIETLTPKMLYLVDPYWTLFGDYYPDWGNYTDYGKLSTRAAAKAAEMRCKSAVKGDTSVNLAVESSTSWLQKWREDSFDWVYLDSSHQYDETLAELRLIASRVKSTGVIMGDDYWIDPKGKHYGVMRAVHAFLREAPFELIRVDKYAQYALRREPS